MVVVGGGVVVVVVVVGGGGAVVVVGGGVCPSGTVVDVTDGTVVVVTTEVDVVDVVVASDVVVVAIGGVVVEGITSKVDANVVGAPLAIGESSTPVRIPVTAADAIVSETIVAPSHAATNPNFLFMLIACTKPAVRGLNQG